MRLRPLKSAGQSPALRERIEVDDETIRISGDKDVLAALIAVSIAPPETFVVLYGDWHPQGNQKKPTSY